MKHKLTDEECIHDLEVIRQDFLETCGAEPMCLGYAIERLKEFSKYVAVKVVGETRNEEPEKQKGEWIFKDEIPKCPFCKTVPRLDDLDEFQLTKFCPECGADLRKEANNDDT